MNDQMEKAEEMRAKIQWPEKWRNSKQIWKFYELRFLHLIRSEFRLWRSWNRWKRKRTFSKFRTRISESRSRSWCRSVSTGETGSTEGWTNSTRGRNKGWCLSLRWYQPCFKVWNLQKSKFSHVVKMQSVQIVFPKSGSNYLQLFETGLSVCVGRQWWYWNRTVHQ